LGRNLKAAKTIIPEIEGTIWSAGIVFPTPCGYVRSDEGKRTKNMQYKINLEATVEAPSAEAAKNLFNDNKEGVISSNVDVMPSKQWAVTVSVPVIYTFDLLVNAETESEVEEIAANEIWFLDVIEDFVQCDMVTDYEYHICGWDAEVESIEALEDEDAHCAAPGTATAA
jgi:hypothetical protein